MLSYLLLFGSAFLAATILPFYSEVVLFALLREGGNAGALVAVPFTPVPGSRLLARDAAAREALVRALVTWSRMWSPVWVFSLMFRLPN